MKKIVIENCRKVRCMSLNSLCILNSFACINHSFACMNHTLACLSILATLSYTREVFGDIFLLVCSCASSDNKGNAVPFMRAFLNFH